MHLTRGNVFVAFIICDVGGAISFELRSAAMMVRTQQSKRIALEAKEVPSLQHAPTAITAQTNSSAAFPFIDSKFHPGCPVRAFLAAIGRRAGGLVLIFVSMTLSAVGFVLQRKAHLLRGQEDSSNRYRPLWLTGVVVYAMAALPDVVAYTLIPQMLCAAMGCLRFAIVSLLGHFFLAERLGRQEVAGIVVCTLGALLCVRFGPGDDTAPLYPGELHSHIVTRYVTTGLVLLAFLFVVVHASSLGTNKMQSFALPCTTALAYGLEKVFNSELTYVPMPEKVLAEPLWLELIGAVSLFGLLDFYLNLRAAQHMPVHMYVPLSFAFGTFIQNFQGLVVFDEIKDMQFSHSFLTFLGVVLALTGALMIHPPQFGYAGTGKQEECKEGTAPQYVPGILR